MAPSLQQKLFVEFVGTALLCFTVSCLPKVRPASVIRRGGAPRLLTAISFSPENCSLSAHRPSSMLSVVAGKSATIAVYWAGPALGAVLGLAIFKAAYKGESKKKSKRKTR